MTDYKTWERRTRRQRIGRYVLILIGIVAAAISWRLLQINYSYLGTAPVEFMDLINRMYPPDVGYTGEIIGPMIETIHIATWGPHLRSCCRSQYRYSGRRTPPRTGIRSCWGSSSFRRRGQ